MPRAIPSKSPAYVEAMIREAVSHVEACISGPLRDLGPRRADADPDLAAYDLAAIAAAASSLMRWTSRVNGPVPAKSSMGRRPTANFLVLNCAIVR